MLIKIVSDVMYSMSYNVARRIEILYRVVVVISISLHDGPDCK